MKSGFEPGIRGHGSLSFENEGTQRDNAGFFARVQYKRSTAAMDNVDYFLGFTYYQFSTDEQGGHTADSVIRDTRKNDEIWK